jgi:DNA polymerase-3 subunit alpha
MEKYKAQFIDGAGENGVSSKDANKIWADIEVFSGYGFNKAHSSGYALVAYQAAYLKAHYPSDYMAANLNSEIGDIDRLVVLIEECRRMGLEVLPPDVNTSFVDFAASEDNVLMGMAAVRNVGRSAVEAIVAARIDDQGFDTLFEFCERVDLKAANRRSIESLISAGALDSLEGHRAQLLEGLGRALEMAQVSQLARQRGQISLFEAEGMSEQAAVVNNQVLPELPEWSERERLSREKEMLGFYLSGHPLAKYRADLFAMGIRSIQDIDGLPDGAELKLGGLLAEVKPHTDRNGRPMAFGTLEDMDGTADLVVFPDAFEKIRDLMVPDAVVVMQGRLSGRNGRTSIQVEQVLPIEKARETLADAVNVLVPIEEVDTLKLETLKELTTKFKGTCAFYLHLQIGKDRRTVIRSRQTQVVCSEELVSEIGELMGEQTKVWVSAEHVRNRRAARTSHAKESDSQARLPATTAASVPA